VAGGHAFIDESTAGDYLLVCSVVPPGSVNDARSTMRGLLLKGQRSLHMKDESDQRRHNILRTIQSLEPSATLYRARPRDYRGPKGARDACIRQAAHDGVDLRLQRMILDKIDSLVARDRAAIIAGAASAGARVVPFDYDHMQRHEEPLLWIADALAWSYARGGSFRAQAAGLLRVVDLRP